MRLSYHSVRLRRASAALVAVCLAACASKPVLDTRAVNSLVTPYGVAANAIPYQGKTVQWGGKIITTHNGPQVTEVQVLAYPLNQRGVPRVNATPQGRFLLRHRGLLDPLDYTAGRWLTSVGTITAVIDTQVGQARAKLPVIKAEQIKLWRYEPERPRVVPYFGIGVGVDL